MLCSILYLDNSDKARFAYLKKHVEKDYVPNKAEFPNTITAVKSIVLNDQTNYNSKY